MSIPGVPNSANAVAADGAGRIPPLLGDGHGHYRVHILGNSGKLNLTWPRSGTG